MYNIQSILLLFCLLFSAINIYYSIKYYVRVKSFWRYVKISYIFSNLFVARLLYQTLRGNPTDGNTQLFALLILLASMSAGLLVSQKKLTMAERIDKLEIHWESRQQDNPD